VCILPYRPLNFKPEQPQQVELFVEEGESHIPEEMLPNKTQPKENYQEQRGNR